MLDTFKALLIIAHLYSGLPLPESSDNIRYSLDQLNIEFLPKDVMEKLVCGEVGSCDGNNLAAYELGTNHIILTDNCLDIENNQYCQAVLLHEMVHFLQYINGRYKINGIGSLSEIKHCSNVIENEAQAYAIQRSFLINQGIDVEWSIKDAIKHYSCKE